MVAKHPLPYGPARVRDNGQIVLPAPLREEMGIALNDRVTFYWWPGESRALMVIGDEPNDEGYGPLTP
jgi:AbrB family looped-hinge helix DNA binding protein